MEKPKSSDITSYTKKKEEIIEAAAVLFHKKGFKGTTIAEIANTVKIPKGGLYHYIENKEELLFTIITRGIREVLPSLRKIISLNIHPEEKLTKAIKIIVLYLATYKEYSSVFLQEKNSLSPQNLQIYNNCRDEVGNIFIEIIKEVFQNNELVIKEVNIKLISYAILGMCNWITQWYKSNGDATAEDISIVFADISKHILSMY